MAKTSSWRLPDYVKSTTGTPACISFHAPTPDYIDPGRLVTHLKSHISLLFGDISLGVSLSSLKIVYWSAATSTAILRVPRNHHRLVWAALSHITELPAPGRRSDTGSGLEKSCVIRVVRVSGTIRKAEEELVRRARMEVVRGRLAMEGGDMLWSKAFLEQKVESAATGQGGDISMRSIEDLSGEEEEDDSD